MMSPASPVRVSAPSTTRHPAGIDVFPQPRQPSVVRPSTNSFQPAACSAGVRALALEASEDAGAAACDAAPLPPLDDEQAKSTAARTIPAEQASRVVVME